MILDKVKKKRKTPPNGGSGTDTESVDLTDQIPAIQEMKEDISKLLKKTDNLIDTLESELARKNRSARRCYC